METTIYLIRHGETDCNREGRYQGQKDTPLNKYGKSQALKLAKRLYNEAIKVDAIYSSDLIRAKETAQAIAEQFSLDVYINIGLRERCFGKLEGLKIEEVKALYTDFDILKCNEVNCYDIETYDSLKSRVYNVVNELSKKYINKNIVIVSHGATINSFLREISNEKLKNSLFRLTNTSISKIVYNHLEEKWKIIKINDIAHIEELKEGEENESI